MLSLDNWALTMRDNWITLTRSAAATGTNATRCVGKDMHAPKSSNVTSHQ